MAWEGRRRGVTVVTLAVLAMGALAACHDDKGPSITAPSGSSSTSTSTSASTSGSSSPSPEVVEGVTLTPQGTALQVGQTATVSYQPRQGQTGVLSITVDRLEKTSFKKSFVGWDLSGHDKKANPYFVRATITNEGGLDLGGRSVPLYIVDGTNTLVEATTFASTFAPCQPEAFPKKFAKGDKVSVCLVYLSPKKGALTAVSFRPTQDFDPITWTGPLKSPKKHHGKGGKGGKNQQKG